MDWWTSAAPSHAQASVAHAHRSLHHLRGGWGGRRTGCATTCCVASGCTCPRAASPWLEPWPKPCPAPPMAHCGACWYTGCTPGSAHESVPYTCTPSSQPPNTVLSSCGTAALVCMATLHRAAEQLSLLQVRTKHAGVQEGTWTTVCTHIPCSLALMGRQGGLPARRTRASRSQPAAAASQQAAPAPAHVQPASQHLFTHGKLVHVG